MKMPEKETLLALCAEFGLDIEALSLIGGGREDNDGAAYRVDKSAGPVVFKVVSLERERVSGIADLDARIAFARFLLDNGAPVSAPIPLADGRLYASAFEEDALFVAYKTPFFPGKNPNPSEQTPKLVRAWGALTGRLHAVTQEYPVWRSMNGSAKEFDYSGEIEGFRSMTDEPELLRRWESMRKELDALPKVRESYGFIHNDNHEQNILAEDGRVALIDFDCACCHFFMNDIVTPLQGLLFETGGMCEPPRDPDRLRRFLDAFMEGYETQYHLGSEWLGKLNLFIAYRRLLLASVLQGLLSQNEGLKNGFYAMMDAPEILSL